MNSENWNDDDYLLENVPPFQQTQSPLNLNASILQNIFRFLTSTKDRYQAALVHPKWTYAAQSVLWEDISFDRPSMFWKFERSVLINNKLAPYVKSIQFIIKDHLSHPHSTHLFEAVAKSTTERHSGDSVLTTQVERLLRIVKACENVTKLILYGWHLKSSHIEQLAAVARNLSSLSVIGADPDPNNINKQPPPLHINSIAPRLQSLKLDGNFRLNEAWAKVLVQKAAHLKELQLTVSCMDSKETLLAICTPHKLHLTKLILTDADRLDNKLIARVFKAFPHLLHFRLEGLKQAYAMPTVLRAIHYCPQLQSLEIRASPSVDQQAPAGTSNLINTLQSIKEEVAQQSWTSLTANVHRLVIENLPITDSELRIIQRYLCQLQTLGMKNCFNLTDSGLKQLLVGGSAVNKQQHEGLKHLRLLHIVQCPQITSATLAHLAARTKHTYQTIQNVYIEQCGEIKPKDIHQLCHKCVDHNLRHLTLVDYPDLDSTVIGSFNHFDSSTTAKPQPPTIYLNRQAIDGLANTNDASVRAYPDPYIIEGCEFDLLATHLGMDMNDLVTLLQRVKQERNAYLAAEQRQHPVQPVPPSKARKNADRLQQLKMEASFTPHHQRPTTPALWSNDLKASGSVLHQPILERTSEVDPSEEYEDSDSQNDNQYVNYTEEELLNDSEISQYDGEITDYNDDVEDEAEEEEENLEQDDMDANGYEESDDSQYDAGNNTDDNINSMNDQRNNNNNDDDDDDDDDEEEEEEEDDYITTFRLPESKRQQRADALASKNKSMNNLSTTWGAQATGRFDLGSWGAPANSNWGSFAFGLNANAPTKNDTNESANSPSEPLTFSDIQQQQQQHPGNLPQQYDANKWTGYTEEDYREHWKQDPLAAGKSMQQFTHRYTPAHHRNSPHIMHADGWGTSTGYTPWNQTEGYVKEVIEQQSKTQFWNRDENGWKVLTADKSALPASNTSATGHEADADQEFPSLTDVAKEQLHKNSAKKTGKSPSAKRASATTRHRTSSVVSSDNSVSWDDDNKDDVVIKTYHSNNKVSAHTNYAKQSGVTGGGSGNANQKSNTNGSANANHPRSWQENFTTEDVESKTAKNTWSSFTNNTINDLTLKPAFSRAARPSTPSKRNQAAAKSSGPQNNTSTIASVNQSNSKASQAATETLIDTDNAPTLNFKLSLTDNDDNDNKEPSDVKRSIWDLDLQTITDDVHFVPTVTGTVTEDEMRTKNEQERKDNLISLLDDTTSPALTTLNTTNSKLLDDLVSPASSATSTPIIANATVRKEAAKAPVHSHYSDLLSLSQDPEDTAISAPAGHSVSPTITPITTLLTAAPATTSDVAANTSAITSNDDIQDFTSLLSGQQESLSTLPAVSNTDTKPSQGTKDESTKSKKRPVKLKIQVPSENSEYQVVPLEFQEDDDYEQIVKNFCEKYSLNEVTYEHIRDQAKDRLTARKTKKVFSDYAKNRKTKKSP